MPATGFTTRTFAEHLQDRGFYEVRESMVRRVYERGLLPEPLRIGRYRVITEADAPAVEGAMRRCGYLRREAMPCPA
jgi:hypothetical protein